MSYVGRPVSASEVEAVGDTLGARLPRDYKHFLLRHNGGRPEPAYIVNAVLSMFYSIDAKEKTDDLLANVRRMRRYLPDGVIPIASDTFGNEICLAIKGKSRGKVYFWDHEGAPERVDIRAKYPMIHFKPPDSPQAPIKDDWPGYPDLGLIADSFAEFLDSFHDFELEDEQVPTKAKPAKTKTAKKQPSKEPGTKQANHIDYGFQLKPR
jgi:hypothetical protein